MPIYILGLIVFTAVCAALIFLPQFAGNKWVFLGLVVLAGALGGHRAAQAAEPRRGGTGLRQDPPVLNSLTHNNFEGKAS